MGENQIQKTGDTGSIESLDIPRAESAGADDAPIFNDILHKMFPPTPIPSASAQGFGRLLTLPFRDPAGVSKGMIELPEAFAKALTNDASGMVDAVSPIRSVQRATDIANNNPNASLWQKVKMNLTGGANDFAQHIPMVGPSVTQAEQAYQNDPDVRQGASPGQKVNAALSAGAGGVQHLLTDEVANLASGYTEDGKPLSGEDLVNNVASLVGKAGLLRSAIPASSGAIMDVLEGTPKTQRGLPRTQGEIDSANNVEGLQAARINQQRREQAQAGTDITSGQLPIPLDERGQAEVLDLAPRVANATKIYSSDVARATETSALLSDNGRIPIEVNTPQKPSAISAGLAAPNLGDWTGKPTAEVDKLTSALPQNEAPPGGESFNDWRDRSIPAMKSIVDEAEANPGSTPIGVTHSRNLQMFQAWLDKGGPPDFSTITPEDLDKQTTSGPASLVRVFRTPEGFLQMVEVDDASAGGAHFVRHGETAYDAPMKGEGPDSTVSDPDRPILPRDQWATTAAAMPPELTEPFREKNSLNADTLSEINRRTLLDTATRKALIDRVTTGDVDQVHEAAIDLLSDPQAWGRVTQGMFDARGAGSTDMQETMLHLMDNTARHSGQTLNSWSETLQQLYDEAFPETQRGTLDERLKAQDLRNDLMKLKRYSENGPISGWNTLGGIYNKAMGLWKGFVVGPMKTAFGIAIPQLGLLGVDFLDAIITDTVNAFKGQSAKLVQGSDVAKLPAFNETASLLMSVASRFGFDRMLDLFNTDENSTMRRSAVDKSIEAVPAVKAALSQGLLFDMDSSLLGHTLSNTMQAAREAKTMAQFEANMRRVGAQIGKPQDMSAPLPGGPFVEGAYNTAHMTSDFVNTFNRFQETEFRKIAYQGRLRANLGAIDPAKLTDPGLYNPETRVSTVPKYGPELTDYLTKPRINSEGEAIPIDPAIREAITDAQDHALRQTFAKTPDGGLIGALYKVLRPMSPWALTFPRSVLNNVMWQIHHSPTWLAEAFKPEFRDAFYNVGDNQLDSTAARDASRQMGQAMSGLVLLNGALHLVQGGEWADRSDPKNKSWRVGAKPWLMVNGDTDEHGNMLPLDISSYQPFSNIMDLVSIGMAKLHGGENHAKVSEMIEHYLNTRQGSANVFNVDDIVRNLDSKDPDVWQNAIMGAIGEWVGGWGRLQSGVKEDVAATRQLLGGVGPAKDALMAGQGVGAATSQLLNAGAPAAAYPRPSQTAEGWSAPVFSNFAPDSLKPQVDVYRNQNPSLEEKPLQGLMRVERRPMTPLEEAFTRAGMDPYAVTKHYHDPTAEYLARDATAKLLADPNLKIGDQTLQEFAKSLANNRNPRINQMYLSEIMKTVHTAADARAKQRDANDNHGIPIHFQKEPGSISKQFGLGDSEASELWRQVLIQKSKEKSTTPQ